MTTFSVSFSLLGHRFGVIADWRGQKKERCYIHRKADGGSRRHGAAEFRRRPRVDEYMQDGGAVWHHGGVDGRPGNVAALVPTLEIGSDIRHTFIMGIGVEACVVKMVASGLLMYYFV
ncbi:hypothetical protein D1007_16331 [Hordeum vulgare]|nr:hypothetical protein D1007_16331 [Hordeum vulgare]